MDGILSSNTSFHLEGGYENQQDKAFFYRDPLFYVGERNYGLSVLYQNLGVFYAHGSISYNYDEKLFISANATARDFDLAAGELAWYQAFFEAQVEANYTFREKIGLGLNLDYIGARHAFSAELNPDLEAMLTPYVDLGLKVDYYYNTRVGAFINLSNLLNSNYDMYLGYRAQGINAMFGFSYRF
jgi:outer membrane cobalamin receptor